MEASSSGESRSPGLTGSRFGPALVLALAAIGPFDLLTNAAAGATYGYSLLWSLVLVYLARYVTLECSARYVIATGESLATGFARLGPWALWCVLLSTALKLHVGNLSMIVLLGSATEILIPWSRPNAAGIEAGLLWGCGFVLMFWGRYALLERFSKPFLALLGLAVVGLAWQARLDFSEALSGILRPSPPAGQGLYSYGLVLMAIVGSSAGSLSNMQYAEFVHAKGWRREEFLAWQRRDLRVGVFSMFAVSALIQLAAAGSFQIGGADLRTPQDFVDQCALFLGPAGGWAAAIGLWVAVFTTFLGTNVGYSMVVANAWRLLRRRGPDAVADERPIADTSIFRWVLSLLCLSPAYALLTTWEPVPLVMLSSAVFVLVLPAIVLILLRLTADRAIMGSLANPQIKNVLLVLLAVAALWLTGRNAVELFSGWRS